MASWKELNETSKLRWEENAEYWDYYMGEHSNRFHRELIRPFTEQLLSVQQGDHVLDIACGNGNFTRRLLELGATVTAIDYSSRMIERARLRTGKKDEVSFHVIDASSYDEVVSLGEASFNHAVANMALMDIADIAPLAEALSVILKPNGVLVFSITHPCFQSPGMRKVKETEEINGQIITRESVQIFHYLTPSPYEAIGIRNQPVAHFMFHRPLHYYFNLFFSKGFVLDGFVEPSFDIDQSSNAFQWNELPPAAIFRFKLQGKTT